MEDNERTFKFSGMIDAFEVSCVLFALWPASDSQEMVLAVRKNTRHSRRALHICLVGWFQID